MFPLHVGNGEVEGTLKGAFKELVKPAVELFILSHVLVA